MVKFFKRDKQTAYPFFLEITRSKGTVLLLPLLLYGIKGKNGEMKMPRNARQKSDSGLYHIMVRGINRQDIFHDVLQDTCLDDNIKVRLSDIKLAAEIKTILNGEPVIALLTMEKKRRNEIIKQIKSIQGSTQRQIARVTGLNQSIVFKA